MKKIFLLFGLSVLLNGCSWIHHGDAAESSKGNGWIGGPDAAGRGTTGVSSGAEGGGGITGSDAAPPR